MHRRALCSVLLSVALPSLAQISVESETTSVIPAGTPEAQGNYRPGAGFLLASSGQGELRFKLFTYVRYLNTQGLNDSYTNAFGRTYDLDPRNDLQLNKVNVQFMGWLRDRRFRYLAYVWTNNTAQGLGAQVVVGGNLTYKVHRSLTVGGGVNALPGVRSTEGNFPYWLTLDNRLIAEEFFRPSYTMGIWARGDVARGVDYQLMVGNNLSQLGIDAGQLDDDISTVSAAIGWNPTTGEYGARSTFGDFEPHDRVATRVGAHFTTSDEDAQSQPDVQAPENVQLRLSDGSTIFTPGLFGQGTWIQRARYSMFSGDAGAKYKGFSIDAAFYQRTISDLRGTGMDSLGVHRFEDQGFQVQLSAMVLPRLLQVYAGYASINGEYGDPSEWRTGLNIYPWKDQEMRFNLEYIQLDGSPVGGLSLPYVVGGTGGVINLNFMMNL